MRRAVDADASKLPAQTDWAMMQFHGAPGVSRHVLQAIERLDIASASGLGIAATRRRAIQTLADERAHAYPTSHH
jgi:hypothetical protein